MTDPIEAIHQALAEIKAAELLSSIERERDREVLFLVHPSHYERVRQALCGLRPDLESRLQAHPSCPVDQMICIDQSKTGPDAR